MPASASMTTVAAAQAIGGPTRTNLTAPILALLLKGMTTTATDHALLIDGERVETGEWTDVRSPYSGDAIGRVAKGGAAEAQRALDAAARVLREPLPAHERARILDTVAHLLEERHDEAAELISAEAGQAAESRPRRGAARRLHLHVRRRRGAQADGRDGADGRVRGRRRQARVHAAHADRDRRRDLAVQLPAQPRRAQDRARARRRLPRRAEARVGDAALRALPRRTSRRRPGCRPAGSTSSRDPRRRSATRWSRTSA